MIRAARAEGTSSACASGNPSAISISIDNDIERIESIGFDCSSRDARYVVERVSMHRLDSYLRLVRDNARAITFSENGSIYHGAPPLKEAHDLLTYDRRVQAVILKYTGILEGQFRARYSCAMTALHGDYALYDQGLFRDQTNWRHAMDGARKEIERQRKRSATVRRALGSDGMVPIGIAVEYMTLGTLSKLYSNTADSEVTSWVAGNMNSTTSELRGWIRTVADVRNVCAHFNPYVVLRQIPSTPKPVRGCQMDNRSPFYIFPLLEKMLGLADGAVVEDGNLNYARRMVADVTSETVPFARMYPATAISLNVPELFMAPDSDVRDSLTAETKGRKR